MSWPRKAGLQIGDRGGIVITTSVRPGPDIFAIGECALEWPNLRFNRPGYRMAKTAADHLNANATEFKGADMSTKPKLMGRGCCQYR